MTGIMMGTMAPHDATAEFGQKTLEAAAEAVLREVNHRLSHRELYGQHGASLQENLWKG